MGLMAKAVITFGGGRGYRVPTANSVIYHSPWWDDSRTVLGTHVTTDKALTFVPFFAGVRLIAESVGRLPLVLYRRKGEDRVRARDKQLYGMLHDEPNPEMSAMTFKSALMGQQLLHGDCYAEREKDDLGRDKYLWPLRADHMQLLSERGTGRRVYRYRIESTGDEVDLPPERVLHIPGFGYDGRRGYSLVTLFRQSLALGLAAEEFGARFFKNGAAPSAVITHPKGWSKDTRDSFVDSLRQGYEGLTAAQRLAIIEEGVSWQSIGMNLEDAQFLETRGFQKGEVATMLGLPPHMIGDVEKTTSWGTGIEEQTLGFVTFSLGAHLDRWAQETNRQLVSPAYGDDYYAEFLLDALLKGRTADRMAAYKELWGMGVINADTIARKENLEPPEDGSGATYYVPANFVAASVPSEEEPEEPTNGNGNGAVSFDDLIPVT